jgi:hypothetical protein
MIATSVAGASELELGKRQDQEEHSQELQQQRQRLLDSAAPSHWGCFAGLDPETKRGYNLTAPCSVEQVEGNGDRADCPEDRKELTECEVEKLHE